MPNSTSLSTKQRAAMLDFMSSSLCFRNQSLPCTSFCSCRSFGLLSRLSRLPSPIRSCHLAKFQFGPRLSLLKTLFSISKTKNNPIFNLSLPERSSVQAISQSLRWSSFGLFSSQLPSPHNIQLPMKLPKQFISQEATFQRERT